MTCHCFRWWSTVASAKTCWDTWCVLFWGFNHIYFFTNQTLWKLHFPSFSLSKWCSHCVLLQSTCYWAKEVLTPSLRRSDVPSQLEHLKPQTESQNWQMIRTQTPLLLSYFRTNWSRIKLQNPSWQTWCHRYNMVWDQDPIIWASGNQIFSITTSSFLNNGNANRWKREVFRKPTQKEIANEKVIIFGRDLYISMQGETLKAHIFMMNINVAMFATTCYCMVCLKSKKRVIRGF